MKISAKGESKYLAKCDVPHPITATIDKVQIETLQNPREDKPILYFQGNQLKALVLNVTNRRVLIAAYGDETDGWAGKPVEIYVNQDVTNSSGEVVGGVRLRIPAATTISKPTTPGKPERTLEENLAWGLAEMDAAKGEDRLDTLAIAMGRLALNEVQKAVVQRRYERNLARLDRATATV